MNGISPLEIDAMSLGQWVALARGWREIHKEKSVEPPSVEELEEAMLKVRGAA